jgi:hypothetical protein
VRLVEAKAAEIEAATASPAAELNAAE